MSGFTVAGLRVLGSRSLGHGGLEVRLRDSLSCSSDPFSCSDTSSELHPVVHQGFGIVRCGGRSAGKGGCRASSFFPRLLQSPHCYPQGHRGLAAGDRPFAPQPFGASLPFSHGDCSVGSPVSPSGGLDGVPGSPGRLPSSSSAPVISALPEVLRGGLRPAVSSSVLRPLDRSAGVHACHGSHLFHHASLRFPDPPLSGRLARPRILISRDSAGEGLSPLALSGAGDSCQSRQELPDSFADAGLSGDESSHASFEGVSDPQTCPEALLNASRVRVLSAAASSSLAAASGGNVFHVLSRSWVSSSDEVLPAPPQCCLSPPSRFHLGVLGRLLPHGSSVVVRRVSSAHRSSSGPSAAKTFPVHRRFRLRLGCLPCGRPAVRLVVSRLFSVFHQPPGIVGCSLRSSGVPSGSSSPVGLPFCGQYDSLVLPQEPRGYPFLHTELRSSGHSASLRGQSGSPGSPVCSGSPECPRGLSKSPLPDSGLRVDALPSGVLGASASVAGDHRPVCDFPLGSSSSLLFSSGGSAVSGYGHHGAAVGRSAGLCLPSFRLAAPCAVEGSAVQGSGAHACGSVLASMSLVSGPSGASGGCPSVPPTAEGSTQTAPLPSLSPEPPCASADCLSYIERSARSFGFSSAVARQLARCRRVSTRVNYQAKWAVYHAWCIRHGHSVSRPSVLKIASFLLYLCRSFSLSFSSIAYYRSMLSEWCLPVCLT